MGLGRDPVGELRRALAGLLAVGGALALFLAAGQSPAEGRANMRVTDASGASPGRLAASADGAWNETGSLRDVHRLGHTATLLKNGKVLVVGGADNNGTPLASAELYDPKSGTWADTAPLKTPRLDHSATLLADGRVLVAGGKGPGTLGSAELYDPDSGTWTQTAPMDSPSYDHTGTLLSGSPATCGVNCGKVVVAGGCCNASRGPIFGSELYDPATNSWAATTIGSVYSHSGHSATFLAAPSPALCGANCGRVLVVGGAGGVSPGVFSDVNPELYDPRVDRSTLTGDQRIRRWSHTATLLESGKVLVAGGSTRQFATILRQAELYDPLSGTWAETGSLNTPRDGHAATLLSGGKVLVAGGRNPGAAALASAEIYDPAAGSWTAVASMVRPRAGSGFSEGPTATLLTGGPALCGSNCGKVLVAGGSGDRSAELFTAPAPPPPPAASIDDTAVVEGDSGEKDVTFTVSLSAASANSVTVDFATADDSATQPADYAARSGTLTFAPGQTSRTVTVQVRGDTLDEPDERFSVNLSNPQNATIADSEGTATISDDDPPPSLSLDDTTVVEGDSGEKDAAFTVSLSAASANSVTVDLATADDSAAQPGDYAFRGETLTFAPGQTSKTVAVQVRGDTVDEPDERFSVNLASPQNATTADAEGIGTITDDDPPAGPGAANPPPAGAPGPGYGGIKDKGRGRDRRKGCVKFRRGVRGRRLGPARLGRTRKAQRSLFKKAKLRPRGGVDRYCITGGGALRIAYPTARLIRPLGRSQRKRIRTRAVLVLTSSRRYQIRGIRPGSGVRNLHRRLRGERRVRVGASVWYIAPGRATRLAFRVRGRRVREIGLADKRLIPSHRAAKRLLRAWRL